MSELALFWRKMNTTFTWKIAIYCDAIDAILTAD